MSPLFCRGIRKGREREKKKTVVDREDEKGEKDRKRKKLTSFIGRIKGRSVRGVIGCSHSIYNVHIADENQARTLSCSHPRYLSPSIT